MRAVVAVCLVLCCFGGMLMSAEAANDKRRHQQKKMRMRVSTAAKHISKMTTSAKLEVLRKAARAGMLTTSQAFALAEKVAFEGFEHATGSGYGIDNTNPDHISFAFISEQYKLETVTTNDQVLVSKDNVAFSLSEMTGVAGDYWSVKNAPENVICSLNTKSQQSQAQRFATAFNDMWQNPDFGLTAPKPPSIKKEMNSYWENGKLMQALEEQLRNMLKGEKAGVEKQGTNVHRGSKYYESLPKDGVTSILKDAIASSGYNGISDMAKGDGNWRALAYNDDHFSGCAQNTYDFGHRLAVHEAHAAGLQWRQATMPVLLRCKQRLQVLTQKITAEKDNAKKLAYIVALEELARAAKIGADNGDQKDRAGFAEVHAAATAPALNAKPQGVTPGNIGVDATWTPYKENPVLFDKIRHDLMAAYAKEGFVTHFLSDQFSSGHVRTPRVELRDICTALIKSAPSAGLTANVMHDEDNWNCLLVANAIGDKWWACGDHRFFDEENAQNRRHLRDTIAATVRQVSDAFVAGLNGAADPTSDRAFVSVGLQMLGSTALLSARESVENTCPMFRPSARGGWETRTDAHPTTGTPRPPVALTNAKYGSSIRTFMNSTLFPAKAKVVITDALPNGAATECTYHPLTSSDCCTAAGRATPHFSADTTPGVDTAATNAVGPETKNPKQAGTRVTFINTCKITQSLQDAGAAVVSAAKTVGSAVVDGVVEYGKAMNAMGMVPGMGFV